MRGDGSIYQRADGRWCASLELPRKDGARRRKVVTARTKSEIIAKLRQVRRDLERAGDLPTSSETLQTWLRYWLDNIAAKRVRPNTLTTYRSQLARHVIPVIGTVRLEKLTADHIRKVHQHITGSSTYALTTHRVLSRALTDAVREGRIHRNPAELLDAPRLARTALQALDVDDAIELVRRALVALDAPVYDPEPVMWAMAVLTGMRRGELIGMELDRITEGFIDLSWQLQRIKSIDTAPADYEYRPLTGGRYLTRPKSAAGWRVIPLVDPLAGLLRAHVGRMAPNGYGLVFTDMRGVPLEPSRVSSRWGELSVSLTGKRVRLHDLRHTTVDLLYEAGVDEDLILEIVGHSTRAMTRNYKRRGNRQRLTGGMQQVSAMLDARAIERADGAGMSA